MKKGFDATGAPKTGEGLPKGVKTDEPKVSLLFDEEDQLNNVE